MGDDTNTFTVAVIGDSFVFGQGVKNEKRFPIILENKLNSIRKTKILSLALPGENAFDNLEKYKIASSSYPIDLYIFVLIVNDLVFNPNPIYGKENVSNVIDTCKNAHKINPVLEEEEKISNDDLYNQSVNDSASNISNLCILDIITSGYPQNAIYFIAEDYFDDSPVMAAYKKPLIEKGFYVLSSTTAQSFPEYQGYFVDPYKFFGVSEKEVHSSALAHTMYADVLFKEIVSNPRWNFIERQ